MMSITHMDVWHSFEESFLDSIIKYQCVYKIIRNVCKKYWSLKRVIRFHSIQALFTNASFCWLSNPKLNSSYQSSIHEGTKAHKRKMVVIVSFYMYNYGLTYYM